MGLFQFSLLGWILFGTQSFQLLLRCLRILTRGMFLFDLVSSEKTPLPAIAHDSMSVKQVEDPVMLKILEQYQKSDKQFFVAIDNGESYTDENMIPSVISETIRIKLSPGHELFGRAWNEEKIETEAVEKAED